jgi:hypothetical protein
MAVLGPCQNGKSYSLECQAVAQITCQFPLARLDPIADEARRSLPPDTIFPAEIGGEEVKLLVGIRQTELAPRLITTLPSGISVYKSKVTDVFGSNICFGGPHEVFTEAYRTAGVNCQTSSIQTLQALFTEVATAYTESPWAFICNKEKATCVQKGLLETSNPKTEVPQVVPYQPEGDKPADLEEKISSSLDSTSSHSHFENSIPAPVLTKKQQAMVILRAQSQNNPSAKPFNQMMPAPLLILPQAPPERKESDTVTEPTAELHETHSASTDKPDRKKEGHTTATPIYPERKPITVKLFNPADQPDASGDLHVANKPHGVGQCSSHSQPPDIYKHDVACLLDASWQTGIVLDMTHPQKHWSGPGMLHCDRLSHQPPYSLCLPSLFQDAKPQPQNAIPPDLTPPPVPPNSDLRPHLPGQTTEPTLVPPSASPGCMEMWNCSTMEKVGDG